MKISELQKIFESATIKPSFKEMHVFLLLIILNEEQHKEGIGRYRLEKELNLSEGKIKTLLDRMKQKDINLIESNNRISGHRITEKGKYLLNELFQYITPPMPPRFDYKKIALGDFAYYCIVRQGLKNINTGMEQRDEVIKIGGTGATCLIYDNQKFKFPDLKEDMDIGIKEKDLDFSINNKDVLIIGTGSNKSIARLGTLTAALNLAKI
jgi:predicted transcriptional regulator